MIADHFSHLAIIMSSFHSPLAFLHVYSEHRLHGTGLLLKFYSYKSCQSKFTPVAIPDREIYTSLKTNSYVNS